MRVHVRVVYVHVHVRADGYLDFVLLHLVHVDVDVLYVHVQMRNLYRQIFDR